VAGIGGYLVLRRGSIASAAGSDPG
jgi:hypothetical protein